MGVVPRAIREVVAIGVATTPQDPFASREGARHRAARREWTVGAQRLPPIAQGAPASAVVEALSSRLAPPDAKFCSGPDRGMGGAATRGAIGREFPPPKTIPTPALTHRTARTNATEQDRPIRHHGDTRKLPRRRQCGPVVGGPLQRSRHAVEGNALVVRSEVRAPRRQRGRHDENQEAGRMGQHGESSFSITMAFRPR